MNILTKAAGATLIVFILLRLSEEVPILLMIAFVTCFLNFWIVPRLIRSFRHRLLMDQLALLEFKAPPNIKYYFYTAIMPIMCALLLAIPLLYIAYGDNRLGKTERQWQAYVEKEHCVFVAIEKADNGPLSTWQCDDGLHQVNINVHNTEQGIAIGEDITPVRYFSYALSTFFIAVAFVFALQTMRQYLFAKRLWRQIQSKCKEGREMLP